MLKVVAVMDSSFSSVMHVKHLSIVLQVTMFGTASSSVPFEGSLVVNCKVINNIL